MTSRENEEILEQISEDPFTTVAGIARNHGVSRQTISRRLREKGIKCFVSAKQTELTEDQKIHRHGYFEYLLENRDQTYFNNILFSDEKTFQSDPVRRRLCYRPVNSRYVNKYLSTTRLSGRISASYWGVIDENGPVTDLVKINGRFNSQKYINMLKRHLLPVIRKRQNASIFMQDNSPVHTAGNVMSFLSRRTFETLSWPPCSPDCNPIENVWDYITRGWPKMRNRSTVALNTLVQHRWNHLRDNPGSRTFTNYTQNYTHSHIQFQHILQHISGISMILYQKDSIKFATEKGIGALIDFLTLDPYATV